MTKQFWLDLGERALKTFAQAVAAALLAGQLITDIDWKAALGLAATAALASVVTSIASASIGNPATASLVGQDHPHTDAGE